MLKDMVFMLGRFSIPRRGTDGRYNMLMQLHSIFSSKSHEWNQLLTKLGDAFINKIIK